MVSEDQEVDRPTEQPATAGTGVDPATKAQVSRWLKWIAKAEKKREPVFKRMKRNMQIARAGADKEWVDSGKYVTPILVRHINQRVSELYAKNPTVAVQRKQRRMYSVWDGTAETLQNVVAAAQTGDPFSAMQLQSILQDIEAVRQYTAMADGVAETLQILISHFLQEQTLNFKKQLKAVVRRAKVASVAYVKIGFQRELEAEPEMDARIQDITSKIKHLEQLQREAARGDITDYSPEMRELQDQLVTLQDQSFAVVREGPVLSYPRANKVIIDPACTHLRSLAGARWIAERFDMTPREIETTYGVDIDPDGGACGDDEDEKTKKVYEVQDKLTKTVFTVVEGHDDFLRAPAEPDAFVEQFFTIFPLVFNEVEDDENIYPPSDVELAEHPQAEYNRAREALREHRIAARPYYVARAGVLTDRDKDQLASHPAHAIVELGGIPENQPVDAVLQRGPAAPIDPNLYEVEQTNNDILRAVGSQEANLGGLSGATATESSIAEASRSSSTSDNVDDLDDLLTDVSRALGALLLLEMSKDKVVEIVGPGAVWPDAPATRQEIVQDLIAEIEAGSSGRPNQAQDLANLERATSLLIQLPGVNPQPLGRKLAKLLDVDPKELVAAGAPSITALNSMFGRPSPASNVPGAQGGQGGGNEKKPPENEQGSQPAFPGDAVDSGGLSRV